MPQDPDPSPTKQPTAEPEQPAEPQPTQQTEEVGDFINRHVFEKDSVFFEG